MRLLRYTAVGLGLITLTAIGFAAYPVIYALSQKET